MTNVPPCRINDCDDPIPSRARQLNRDIAEVPQAGDRNVVNVASSMVTAPLIKSGPCSGKSMNQKYFVAQSSGTESVKADSVAVCA